MKVIIPCSDRAELERRCNAGYNHTYKYEIKFDEVPQPAAEHVDAILDGLRTIAAITGAELTVEVENV